MSGTKKPTQPVKLAGEEPDGMGEKSEKQYTRQQLEAAREFYTGTLVPWRRRNADLWDRHVVPFVMGRAADGKRVSGRLVIELLRSKDIADADGRDARLTNDAVPVVSRWLMVEHPELGSHMKLRRSIYDEVM